MEKLFVDMRASGIHTEGAMERFDAQVQQSIERFLARLDSPRRSAASHLCTEGAQSAIDRFDAMMNGREGNTSGAPVGNGHAASRLVAEAGIDDNEHPIHEGRPLRLQHHLAKLLDEHNVDTLSHYFAHHGQQYDIDRIKELRDDSVSHAWLWSLDDSPNDADSHEFTTAVRLRLGAQHADDAQACQACGANVLDPQCRHAWLCANGESTRGHNSVRDCLLDFVRLADSTSEPEVLGLIACAPGLRPADILTTALGENQTTALDVGVVAPNARSVREDCTESMRRTKIGRYAPFEADLAGQQVVYRPLIWSCFGREHADTSAVLTAIARRAARRKGLADFRPLIFNARASIGAALARRSARMVLSCQARLSSRSLALLT